MKKVDIIQAMRCICVFMVVFFHCKDMIHLGSLPLGTILFNNGNSGVDIFFIISGFIMIYTASEKSGTAAGFRFLINRFSRVFPLYLIATVVYILITHNLTWWMSQNHIFKFIRDMAFLPQLNGQYPPFYGYPLLFVGWTLRFEMFFYLIFGLSLMAGRYKLIVMYGIFALLLIALPLATNNFRISAHTISHYSLSTLDMITNPIISEFIAGMLLGHFYKSKYLVPKPAALALIVIAIIMFIAQYFFNVLPGHGLTGWGIFSVMIMGSLLAYNKSQEIKIPYWMIFLGNISYSVYLLHTVVAVAIIFGGRALHLSGDADKHFWYLPLYIPAIIVICYTSYTWIEQRFSNFIKFKIFTAVGL